MKKLTQILAMLTIVIFAACSEEDTFSNQESTVKKPNLTVKNQSKRNMQLAPEIVKKPTCY